MAEPEATTPTPPTSAGPGNTSLPEGVKQEAAVKSEQPTGKIPEENKKDIMPDDTGTGVS